MYKPIEVTEDIFYVGVNDRTKHLFESLWPLPQGVSYNSYIIKDEKTVLIDTVDICYSDLFMRKIRSVSGDNPIDYLVVNHMEPDHSGSIEFLVSKYPDIQIVGNTPQAHVLQFRVKRSQVNRNQVLRDAVNGKPREIGAYPIPPDNRFIVSGNQTVNCFVLVHDLVRPEVSVKKLPHCV